MKKVIKGLSLFILLILSFVIVNRVEALDQSPYISVNDTENLTVGDLSFLNLTFNDNSSTSTLSFGLTGRVYSTSLDTNNYKINVYYYDINYKLLGQNSNVVSLTDGIKSLNLMSNLSTLNGYNVSEISYYRLTVTTTNITETSSITPSKTGQYGFKDYVIDKYDVNIIVNENNTLDITETITAYFNVSKHGIYRTIPLKNTVVRLDGTTSKNKTQITNLSIDNEYTTSRENENFKIQIGSASHTVTGSQTYVIKYTYNLGKDPIKGYDELYYNIIGDEWDTVIGNITFTITMPKEFDSSKLGFSTGKTGSTDNSKIKYDVNGNKITGSYNGILNEKEALTIRCELTEGYFVNAGLTFNLKDYLPLIFPIIFLAVALLIWYKFGRDDEVIETVEFYPPEGFNSLEVGFLYKGKADSKDVTSLLIYLADKGYLKITETEEKSLFFKSKGFKITKLKEYDGNNINERIFLNGLFTRNRGFKSLFTKEDEYDANSLNEVTSLDLYDNFYITMNKILANINNKENKNRIFEKTASSKSIFIILLIIATYCIITIPPILNYGTSYNLLAALLFPGIGFTFMIRMLLLGKQTIYVNGRATNSRVLTILFGLVWGGIFGGAPWMALVFPALKQDSIYLVGYIIGLISIVGMIICLKYLPKRTKYGNEILGKLKGFKNFLETAEKEKLEAMVMQNPTYFYNILPYTYVLGVSDIWIKKFETISLQAPSWYDSPNAFDILTFETFINNTMVNAQSAMSSSPSSSSGGSGGSSGGGSSGGGSGGGGGGSW